MKSTTATDSKPGNHLDCLWPLFSRLETWYTFCSFDCSAKSDRGLWVDRFNELRKVRNRAKTSGMERPFSRMYNFYTLVLGDKWARTGTKFRPRNGKGFPKLLESIAQLEVRATRLLFTFSAPFDCTSLGGAHNSFHDSFSE